MTNKKGTKRAFLMSLLSLLLCVSMFVGTTFAWFTDEVTSAGNIIKSGKLKVEMTWSDTANGEYKDASEGAIFDYQYWEPGYTEVKYVKIENVGNLAFKYKLSIIPDELPAAGKENLADVIDVYLLPAETAKNMTREQILATTPVGTLSSLMADPDGAAYGIMLPTEGSQNVTIAPEDEAIAVEGSATYCIVLHMQESAGNEYQDLTVGNGFSVQLLATQYTWEKDSFDHEYDEDATYPEINKADTWDGTADTSWYNENDTEFVITTAEQLAGFGELVDGGNTFAGKTVKLGANLDLYLEGENGEPVSFNPIGYGYDIVFKGTFDGQGNTISNLYQNGWALGYDYSTEAGGLFASVVDATIKNVTIDNAEIVMECVDMGVLVGYSYGNCTYENIQIKNSLIANYQRYTGGVVGEVNGTQTFKNVDVDAGTTVSSLWGDFDCSLGGIIGGKYGDAQITMEDCDVACELNAYNDVTSSYQWYAYRRAGMLIGNSEETVTVDGRTSATASYLTATNCTVTYGDWANYTYCEFAGTNWPYVRVQAGYSCDAYSNPRYGVATDANGNKAVDDTHVHNEGEDHDILLVFDQLFGGGQGVYGTATHDGVTVIYDNQ